MAGSTTDANRRGYAVGTVSRIPDCSIPASGMEGVELGVGDDLVVGVETDVPEQGLQDPQRG